MPASHLASVTGEPSSDLRHSAFEISEPNERKGSNKESHKEIVQTSLAYIG